MLERNTNEAWVGGVAAGLADRYELNVYLVRTFFVASFFLLGFGLVLYWWLWFNTPGSNNQIRMNFSS